MLVSNNPRLGLVIGSGTRPRIDEGELGITVIGAVCGQGLDGRSLQRPWRAWSAPTFVVDSKEPVPAGVDGEALLRDPPLTFSIRHRVPRVRG